MNLSSRLLGAIDHMEWMTSPPHALHQIIGIYAEVLAGKSMRFRHGATPDEMADALKAAAYDGGRAGKGSHSDPTPDAALRHEPDADDGDETIAQMRYSESELHAFTMVLAEHLEVNTLTDGWTGLHGARMLATRCLSLLDEDDHTARSIVTDITDTAEWLHAKAQWIWTTANGEALPVVEQKRRDPCRICAPYHAPHADPARAIPGTGGRCEACATFHGNHPGFDRTEAIWRSNEYGRQATRGQLAEARAAAAAAAAGKGKKRRAPAV